MTPWPGASSWQSRQSISCGRQAAALQWRQQAAAALPGNVHCTAPAVAQMSTRLECWKDDALSRAATLEAPDVESFCSRGGGHHPSNWRSRRRLTSAADGGRAAACLPQHSRPADPLPPPPAHPLLLVSSKGRLEFLDDLRTRAVDGWIGADAACACCGGAFCGGIGWAARISGVAATMATGTLHAAHPPHWRCSAGGGRRRWTDSGRRVGCRRPRCMLACRRWTAPGTWVW